MLGLGLVVLGLWDQAFLVSEGPSSVRRFVFSKSMFCKSEGPCTLPFWNLGPKGPSLLWCCEPHSILEVYMDPPGNVSS